MYDMKALYEAESVEDASSPAAAASAGADHCGGKRCSGADQGRKNEPV